MGWSVQARAGPNEARPRAQSYSSGAKVSHNMVYTVLVGKNKSMLGSSTKIMFQ